LAKRRAPGSKVISSAPNYDERVGNPLAIAAVVRELFGAGQTKG